MRYAVLRIGATRFSSSSLFGWFRGSLSPEEPASSRCAARVSGLYSLLGAGWAAWLPRQVHCSAMRRTRLCLASVLSIVTLLVTVLTACDSFQSQQPQPQNQLPTKPHYQRFVPISQEGVMMEGVPWHGYFALDTKTGTLCRTIINKQFPQGSWANDIPACAQALTANPD
jgi:hypothetical protein